MGTKINPPPQKKKNLDLKLTQIKSHAKFLSLKNFQKALTDITCHTFFSCTWYLQNYAARMHWCTTMDLQIVLNTLKYPYINHATQKNICQNFLPQKILWSSQSGVLRTPLGLEYSHPYEWMCHKDAPIIHFEQ